MRHTFLVFLSALASIAPADVSVSWRKVRSHRAGWYEATANVPRFRGGALAKFASREAMAHAQGAVDAFLRDARQLKARPEHAWSFDWGARVSVARDGFVSLYGARYWYTGGAHPNRDYTALNFALVRGTPKKVGLADLLLVRMTPEAWASQRVLPRLKEMGASGVVDGSVTMLTRQQADNFVVTPAGITWLFSPYEVASYAEGEFFVKVPWSELGGLDFRGVLAGLAPDPG